MSGVPPRMPCRCRWAALAGGMQKSPCRKVFRGACPAKRRSTGSFAGEWWRGAALAKLRRRECGEVGGRSRVPVAQFVNSAYTAEGFCRNFEVTLASGMNNLEIARPSRREGHFFRVVADLHANHQEGNQHDVASTWNSKALASMPI